MPRWFNYLRTKHVEFANWSAGVQSLLIGIGVIVGAGWTIYLFQALHEKDNAATSFLRSQAELQSLQLNVEKAREESRRAFGLVTLTTAPVGADTTGPCYLQVNATVSNAGNREIRLSFQGDSLYPPLNVAHVSVDTSHAFDFRSIAQVHVHSFTAEGDTVLPMEQSRLLPGESSTYPFLVRIPRQGVYLVQFRVPVDTALSFPEGRLPPREWYWAARSYVSGCEHSRSAPTPPTRDAQG